MDATAAAFFFDLVGLYLQPRASIVEVPTYVEKFFWKCCLFSRVWLVEGLVHFGWVPCVSAFRTQDATLTLISPSGGCDEFTFVNLRSDASQVPLRQRLSTKTEHFASIDTRFHFSSQRKPIQGLHMSRVLYDGLGPTPLGRAHKITRDLLERRAGCQDMMYGDEATSTARVG